MQIQVFYLTKQSEANKSSVYAFEILRFAQNDNNMSIIYSKNTACLP